MTHRSPASAFSNLTVPSKICSKLFCVVAWRTTGIHGYGMRSWRSWCRFFRYGEEILVFASTYVWLVADLPIWKIWKSGGMMTFPIYGKIKNVWNHQPDVVTIQISLAKTWKRRPNQSSQLSGLQVPWILSSSPCVADSRYHERIRISGNSHCVHQFSGVFIVFSMFFYSVHMFSQIFPASFIAIFQQQPPNNPPIASTGPWFPHHVSLAHSEQGLGLELEDGEIRYADVTDKRKDHQQSRVNKTRGMQILDRWWNYLDVHHGISWNMLNLKFFRSEPFFTKFHWPKLLTSSNLRSARILHDPILHSLETFLSGLFIELISSKLCPTRLARDLFTFFPIKPNQISAPKKHCLRFYTCPNGPNGSSRLQ